MRASCTKGIPSASSGERILRTANFFSFHGCAPHRFPCKQRFDDARFSVRQAADSSTGHSAGRSGSQCTSGERPSSAPTNRSPAQRRSCAQINVRSASARRVQEPTPAGAKVGVVVLACSTSSTLGTSTPCLASGRGGTWCVGARTRCPARTRGSRVRGTGAAGSVPDRGGGLRPYAGCFKGGGSLETVGLAAESRRRADLAGTRNATPEPTRRAGGPTRTGGEPAATALGCRARERRPEPTNLVVCPEMLESISFKSSTAIIKS